MKIKDLRKIIKGLPGNMEIVVDTGIEPELNNQTQGYNSLVVPVKKAKTKLTKTILGYEMVQGRPTKDLKAKLKLVLQ